MRVLRGVVVFLLVTIWASSGMAQGQVWVQIEARPNLASGNQRAADYASRIADVNGFRLRSGWYAVALGPFTANEAQERLRQLRNARQIPRDSFIADGSQFREQFFGPTQAAAVAPEPAEPLEPLKPGEETVQEARAGERLLNREERAELQIALRWEGFYNSTIDASFGPGTRRAMAAWQENRRYEPTGVLTTLQRRELVDGYQTVLRELNMQPVVDSTAGVTIDMPAGLVAFDRYEPPFAHYNATTDDNVRVLLISQSGDENTLAALYDILQTLEIVPVDGSRALRRSDFTMTGANDRVASYTYAKLDRGEIKGFTLVWPADDEKRRQLALQQMQSSFATLDGVLPDTLGSTEQNIDLLSGLEIRRPTVSQSGFYVDASGAVLTSSNAVAQCSRITLNEDVEADVVASDESRGLALLRPQSPQAPLAVARLASVEPRLQSDIALAGFSFGGVLTAPSVTFGTLADVRGLDGNRDVQRLEVASEPGDTGGPVFDERGTVTGMLLSPEQSSRQLPGDVAFALDAPVMSAFLEANGLIARDGDSGDALAPEDLTLLAADLTVLVSCWN